MTKLIKTTLSVIAIVFATSTTTVSFATTSSVKPYKAKTKEKVKVTKKISFGKIRAQTKDTRTHTPKEIKEHKDTMGGKATVGFSAEF